MNQGSRRSNGPSASTGGTLRAGGTSEQDDAPTPERVQAASSGRATDDAAASAAGDPAIQTYAPLDVLKPVAPGVWIVDGPVVRMGAAGVGFPFPTRMTVIRLSGGRLFVHSPTPLAATLAYELAQLGRVTWLVAPNRLHRTWLDLWAAADPGAGVFVAPRVRVTGDLAGRAQVIDATSGYPWDDELATLPVRGRYLTEVVFFHRRSRTLVLTDIIENFEPERIGSRLVRWLVRIGGVAAPHGGMARDMRATFRRPELRAAVEQMIAWGPERILIAHGRWISRDGAAALAAAFDWLLR
jgi:hypothetical protein